MKELQKMKKEHKKFIKTQLSQLNIKQFKIFYATLIHCRAHKYDFISTQNFFDLWCELNVLCYELDESFPDPYDDYQLIKDFWHTHPYFFIDCLPRILIAKLFAKYCDTNLDVLATFIQILHDQNAYAANKYIIDAFRLDHSADEFTIDMQNHIEHNS